MSTVNSPRQENLQTAAGVELKASSSIDPIARLLDSIAAQFELAMPRPEQVEGDCEELRKQLGDFSEARASAYLTRLTPLLGMRAGRIAIPVFKLLEEAVDVCAEPWPLLRGMLVARDPNLARRTLDLIVSCIESRSLSVDRPSAELVAECVEADGSPLSDHVQLGKIGKILAHLATERPESGESVLSLYMSDHNHTLRRLAARILDRSRQPVPAEIAEQLLGPAAAVFLRPYLEYTRAGYLDLLSLTTEKSILAGTLESIRRAETICGETLLKEAIGKLGWTRLNLGLAVSHHIGISIGGSFPALAAPDEIPLLEGSGDTRRTGEFYLFIGHGGMTAKCEKAVGGGDEVALFRRYNLTHAEALADILDFAPLTREKVERILGRMDRIVQDFVALFASSSNECAILPGIYRDLKQKILLELGRESTQPQLSAELTRLVQMFEDPRAIGGIRTLHGLKRYLHQRGLRLGMRLVGSGHETNRTLDLLLLSRLRPPRVFRRIRYIDFESQSAEGDRGIPVPYPVAILAEGFQRQVLVGEEKLPEAKVFCYGNEVHYYLSFGNHPAFVRIDYSPPLQGGMIDLEYYGVSKYEMSHHPNPALDAIRVFFQSMNFDIQIDQTRIHARYDKERALDRASICEKARALFRLVAYLMEIDWVIGGLNLSAVGRSKVAEAWASFLGVWGSVPVGQFLSSDRRGILIDIEAGPAADREILWTGEGPYRCRWTVQFPRGWIDGVQARLVKAGLLEDTSPGESEGLPCGQLALERKLLIPLRQALRRGELRRSPGGIEPCPPGLFQRIHEAEIFAELLASPGDALLASARLAMLVAPLERTLRFHTTGSVNGHATQNAALPVQGEPLGIYVLRDSDEIIRFALFTSQAALYRHRELQSDSWQRSWNYDPVEMASLLRGCNSLAAGSEQLLDATLEEVMATGERLRQPNPLWHPGPIAGEKIITGLKASPGRAVGTVLFGTLGRAPDDFVGSILVASSVQPADSAFLYRSAGIVSTGGGILSHAGLIALQFGKPALVVPGDWTQEDGRLIALSYRTLEYTEEERKAFGSQITVRRDVRERVHCLREGDLVVLDANEGFLRVLGQKGEALALQEGFHRLGDASIQLPHLTDGRDILIQRGHRLRARHQIERMLVRLSEPVLACHAVEEILKGKVLASGISAGEEACLLSLLLENPRVRDSALGCLRRIVCGMESRYNSLFKEIERRLSASSSIYEILSLRLEVMRLLQSLEHVGPLLRSCHLAPVRIDGGAKKFVDRASRRRLMQIRNQHYAAVMEPAASPGGKFSTRHVLRQLEQIDSVLGIPGEGSEALHQFRGRLALADEAALTGHRAKDVVFPEDGGFELHSIMGWKAANLAEIERLAGRGLVPPWFAITHCAFEKVLDLPTACIPEDLTRFMPRACSLREGIDAILARAELGHAQQSAFIRALWENARLPAGPVAEILRAYHRLFPEDTDDLSSGFVAIRSSAREEDSELATRAGEFETFLFVRGDGPLLTHLKRTWSGLWTERGIHNRSVLGLGNEQTGGGVIVQRIVGSRVSGVLQTANASDCEQQQMVINAGLGLGEGIVSGRVAADQIVVAKEGDFDRGLHLRYITADKREQMVFNRRGGQGTALVETLYHQRLRPALEYVELCELVRTAVKLERAYGYALDIEFAFEGTRLWILQARPIVSFLSAVRDTLERYPLSSEE